MSEPSIVGPEPSGVFAALDELMKRPLDPVGRAASDTSFAPTLRLLAASLLCCAAYGAAAGCFQGGGQVLLASVKAPLIVAWTLVLCAPSLYVFASLSGATFGGRKFMAVLAAFAAMQGLLLAGLLPIGWLFSVSSRSLAFLVWLHLVVWLIALGFAGRMLRATLRECGARTDLGAWLILYCLVAFQVATVVRPVLWRPPEGRLIETERTFFLEHFARSIDATQK